MSDVQKINDFEGFVRQNLARVDATLTEKTRLMDQHREKADDFADQVVSLKYLKESLRNSLSGKGTIDLVLEHENFNGANDEQ